MGQPKATLRLQTGSLLLDQVYRATEELKLPVTLIGTGPVTDDVKHLDRIPDAPGVPGPLAGILAAMEHDPGAAWMILACDLPLIRREGIQWLLSQRTEGTSAIIPRLSESRVEPLFAIYEPESRSLLRTISQSGSPAPKRLVEHEQIESPEPPHDLRACWTNINTPDDLATLSAHRA